MASSRQTLTIFYERTQNKEENVSLKVTMKNPFRFKRRSLCPLCPLWLNRMLHILNTLILKEARLKDFIYFPLSCFSGSRTIFHNSTQNKVENVSLKVAKKTHSGQNKVLCALCVLCGKKNATYNALIAKPPCPLR